MDGALYLNRCFRRLGTREIWWCYARTPLWYVLECNGVSVPVTPGALRTEYEQLDEYESGWVVRVRASRWSR